VDAQCLYVRLALRRGPLFRTDKLRYTEVSDLAAAIDELLGAGLLQVCDAVLPCLLRDELKQIVRRLGIEVGQQRRDDILTHLEASLRAHALAAALPLRVVSVIGLEVVKVLKLLFFGYLRQDFTEFVLRDLGVAPFEDYPIGTAASLFDSRSTVDWILLLREFSEASRVVVQTRDVRLICGFADALSDVCAGPEPARLADGASRRETCNPVETQADDLRVPNDDLYLGRILHRVARELERVGALAEAAGLYERTPHEPARERLVRLRVKLGDEVAARQLIEAIAAHPASADELEFAQSFYTRHARRCGWPDTVGLYVSARHRAQTEVLPLRCRSSSVEADVAAYYEEQGYIARFVENGWWPSLFGLVFWDIIFHPLEGQFFQPFQRGPADIFGPDFRTNRANLIAERLQAIGDRDYLRSRLQHYFDSRFSVANHFVHWGVVDQPLLDLTLLHVPTRDLRAVFTEMLANLAERRSGFPDLVLFSDAGYEMVEVKGPGDRLQTNQKRWFERFHAAGMPAKVCHVRYT